MLRTLLTTAILLSSLVINAQLLWRISGNDTLNIKDSYIFGTHHIAPTSITDSIVGLEQALNDCDEVWGEVVITEMTGAVAQQKMLQAAMAPNDSSLNSLFTQAQYDSINFILQELSSGLISLNQLNRFKPAFINTQLASLMAIKSFPQYSQGEQLDIMIQNWALSLGKSVNGLESYDAQLDMLLNYPISQQAEELLETVHNYDLEISSSKALASAYLSQDLEKLWQLMQDPQLGLSEDEKQRLLDNRNITWVSTLIPVLRQKSIIICVGAGHLPGKSGLIALLRDKGFNVTSVK